MSKQGLYDQLTSEYGEAFPADAAQYAIDNLQADYKANALEKAKTYYYDMNMSKSGVYDQLISERCIALPLLRHSCTPEGRYPPVLGFLPLVWDLLPVG